MKIFKKILGSSIDGFISVLSGEYKGTIINEKGHLRIGPDASIDVDEIIAGTIEIYGRVNAKRIRANTIELLRNANVTADMKSRYLVISPTVTYNGRHQTIE